MDARMVTGVGRGWMGATPQDLAQYSPQLALARAKRIPFAPYLLNVRATFFDANTLTLNPVSFEQNGTISQPSIVDRVMFEIDAPNSNAGAQLKGLSDYFFGLQSGIQARLDVLGAPRYTIAPFFTPIRSLAAMINEEWPTGWVLTHTQSVSMQFQQTQGALPSYPTSICVTFRMWQPVGSTEFIQMTDGEARAELAKICGS